MWEWVIGGVAGRDSEYKSCFEQIDSDITWPARIWTPLVSDSDHIQVPQTFVKFLSHLYPRVHDLRQVPMLLHIIIGIIPTLLIFIIVLFIMVLPIPIILVIFSF